MTELASPRTIINQLNMNAEKVSDAEIRNSMLQAASSIEYLLLLLKECDQYIDGVREYPEPPLFIRAVRDALKE